MKPTDLLHREIREVLGAFEAPAMSGDQIAVFREMDWPAGPSTTTIQRAEYLVPGDPDVPIRLHRPTGVTGSLPCVYSIHGGGYVIGDYSMDDTFFEEVCPALGVIGISVQYRLAPEAAYPAALEDCYSGLRWVYEHAEDLGIERECVGVRGISAGGGLAAALALLCRDRDQIPLAFQLLDCPMLDDRQITHSSRTDGLPVWSRESNTFGWQSYLGDLYGKDTIPYAAAPARADDLAGLPPAFVSVGTVDGFLDEDVDYALRLNHAQVPTELHVYPGACHGYQMAAESDVAMQSLRDMKNWLRRMTRVDGSEVDRDA